MKKRIAILLAASLPLWAALLPAAEPEPADSEAEPAAGAPEQAQEEAQEEPRDDDAGGGPDRDAASRGEELIVEEDGERAQAEGDDTFVPSQQISEDLSVSFPVDI